MTSQSRILVIGATGYIGKFIAEAGAKAGHSTYALIRQSTLSDPAKAPLIQKFNNLGINLVPGDLYDHESLVKTIKQADVVISTVGRGMVADQLKIISTIKEAGNVKRFFPSEFGNDVDHVHAVEPATAFYDAKVRIRRAVEAEGIPYTYVACNFFADYYLPNMCQWDAKAPPRDKFVIMGDGNQKAVFVKEEDIAAFTIRAVDDPRTLNKVLYMRPPGNVYSLNKLASLWEKKIGKTLERVYLSEDEVLKNIQEADPAKRVILAIRHSAYVKGDHTNFDIDPSFGVEASELYPGVNYSTVEDLIDQFV